jgi:hypothetical protein
MTPLLPSAPHAKARQGKKEWRLYIKAEVEAQT